jgi:hypothetical protein
VTAVIRKLLALTGTSVAACWCLGRGTRGCRSVNGIVGELGRVLELRERISRAVHGAGFTYVALDVDGFRSGSMNEA